jgi:hypothetical protein
MHARRGGEQGGDDATPVAGQRFLQLMQLLPIIILVLFTLLSFGSGPAQEERWYSLQEQEPFLVRRYTSGVGGITRDIPYYVKTDFQRRVGENRHVLPTVRCRAAGWMIVRGCQGCPEGSIVGAANLDERFPVTNFHLAPSLMRPCRLSVLCRTRCT